jgi:hypothetical protein
MQRTPFRLLHHHHHHLHRRHLSLSLPPSTPMLSANTFSDDEFELPNADHDAADATRRRSADGYARSFPRILCAPVQPPHPAVAPSCPSILFLDLQLLHVVRSYRPKTASACTLDIASIECATPPRACVTGGVEISSRVASLVRRPG